MGVGLGLGVALQNLPRTLLAQVVGLFANGEPGFLYDNNDYTPPMQWATNKLTYSNQFDNAAWTKTRASVVANAAIGPDGELTADKLVEDSTAANTHAIQQTPVMFLAGTTYTLSVYLKAGERTFARVQFPSTAFGAVARIDVNLTTGAITGTGGGPINPLVEDAGNGWYRCSLSAVATVTIASGPTILLEDVANNASYNGDGVSGLYLAKAQVNTGLLTDYQRITDLSAEYLAAFPLCSMFADSLGSAPAMLNGPLGLQLDQRFGKAFGTDARANGAPAMSGAATVATYNSSTGAATCERVSSGNQSYIQFSGLSPNTFYRIALTNTGGLAIAARTGDVTGTAFATLAAGLSATVWGLSSATGTIAVSASTTNGSASFTLDSIKSIAGLHRYQGTSASRPTLRGTPTGAPLPVVFQLPDAGWIDSGGGVATGTATTGEIQVAFNPVTGRTYRVRWTTALTGGSIRMICGGDTGTTRTASGTYERYFTASSTGVMRFDGVSAFTGTVSNIIIEDVTWDSVTAPYGIQYDGVDDSLQTAAANFTGTDAVTISVGLRKFTDATTGVLLEFGASSTATDGSFGFLVPSSGSANNVRFGSRGNLAVTVSAVAAAPVTVVATGLADISTDTCIIRTDGVQQTGTAADQGAGNYGNHAFYFGRREGTSLPVNAMDFGPVCLGRTTADPELAAIEALTTNRTTGA